MFFGENKFNLSESAERRLGCCKTNKASRIKNLKPTMKYNTGSLIVLGYISTVIVVELAFIDEIADENKLYRYLEAKFYKKHHMRALLNICAFYTTLISSV